MNTESMPHKIKKINGYNQSHAFLINLRNELYEGDWDQMVKDLEDRKASKPYIFKLTNRIDNDLEQIRELKVLPESELAAIHGGLCLA